MKLHSSNLELRAIKTICAGGKAGNRVLGKLHEDMLNTSAAQTAYRRIVALTRKGGELPSWQTLCEDPVISEKDRAVLQKFKKPSFKVKETKSSLNTLKKYAHKRGLLLLAEEIVNTLQEDQVDVEKLVNTTVDHVHKIRAGSKQAKVWRFGDKSNSGGMLKSIVKGKGVKGIPTYYDPWDNVNKVIPESAVMMLAGPTGGGKSQVALNMAMNQAEGGFTVCMGSFEMSPEENMVRMIARESQIPMHKVQRGQEGMSKAERKKAVKSYLNWEKRCKKSGGALFIVENETLPTPIEFLYSCKAYAPDIIIIDYLALMDGIDGDDDWRKLAEAVRQCKRFAKANKIPVVFLAQLADDGASLRYSKRMLDDCDIAWFWKADPEDREAGLLPVTHKKARNVNPVPFSFAADMSIASMKGATDKDIARAKKKRIDKASGGMGMKGKAIKGSDKKRVVLRDLASSNMDDL